MLPLEGRRRPSFLGCGGAPGQRAIRMSFYLIAWSERSASARGPDGSASAPFQGRDRARSEARQHRVDRHGPAAVDRPSAPAEPPRDLRLGQTLDQRDRRCATSVASPSIAPASMQRCTRFTIRIRTDPLASSSEGPGSKSLKGRENITRVSCGFAMMKARQATPSARRSATGRRSPASLRAGRAEPGTPRRTPPGPARAFRRTARRQPALGLGDRRSRAP